MIEILKTSDGKKACLEKLSNSIIEKNKCVLIVDSDDYSLANFLKKRHIFMDTFVEEDYLKKDNFLFSYPYVYKKKKGQKIYKSDLNNSNFFLSSVEFDIFGEEDILNTTLINLHKSLYKSQSNSDYNYFIIVSPTHTFKINRNIDCNENVTEDTCNFNLNTQKNFKNKSDFFLCPSHGLTFLSCTNNEKYYDLSSNFINSLKVFFESKTEKSITMTNYDLFIDNKKFFGGDITNISSNENKFTLSSMMICSEFEPEKDFFFKNMNYSGKHTYTGISEEIKNVKLSEIYKYIVTKLISLVY